MRDSRLYGVELTVSVEGLQNNFTLMPQLKSSDLKRAKFEKDSFDVIVGNVPFGAYKIFDPEYKKYGFPYSRLFFGKIHGPASPWRNHCG